jgi:alpha-tubulin suppressor-like RCC1 family protein
LLSKGNVRCWGGNTKGQLGLGNTVDFTTNKPYQNNLIGLGAPALALAAGADHTCALMADASMRCWGANDHGQLGLGNTAPIGDNELPTSSNAGVDLGRGVRAIAAGGNVTCAILQDNSLRCWGQNNFGQLGLGHTNDIGDDEIPTDTLARVNLGDDVLLVATGGNHTCAILPGNHGRCWGRNGLAQLGLGILENIGDDELPTKPDPIVFSEQVTSLVVGATRTCALLSEPSESCWGDNDDGGLGWGFVGTDPLLKATDWGLFSWHEPVIQIAAGWFHMCVDVSDHQLRCWGINNKAQLGLPNTQTLGDSDSVTAVSPVDLGVDADGSPSYAKAMATGAAHTCVILGNGNVRCWGANESGQLGLGFVSVAPLDYVGGTAESVPGKLENVIVGGP